MASAMFDRLSRAVPFNSLFSHLSRHRFADLVAARCCAAAHFALFTASITRSCKNLARLTALPSPAGLRPANRLNQDLADSRDRSDST